MFNNIRKWQRYFTIFIRTTLPVKLQLKRIAFIIMLGGITGSTSK